MAAALLYDVKYVIEGLPHDANRPAAGVRLKIVPRMCGIFIVPQTAG